MMGQSGLTVIFWKIYKLRKIYEFRDFSDPAEIYGKFPNIYGKPQKLRKNYRKHTNSGNFQAFFVTFG